MSTFDVLSRALRVLDRGPLAPALCASSAVPLLFHPADPKMLLFATNVLWKTTSGGQSWEIVSPDGVERGHADDSEYGGAQGWVAGNHRAQANLTEVERGLREAAQRGVELVVLPEMWPTSFPDAGVEDRKSVV